MDYIKMPCVIIRGGTSKGVFFNAADLPADPDERDRVVLSAFGSPDPRQVDGLGGADPLTSKLAIIKKSERPGVDIDYTFGQVGINEAAVNYSLNCGNISSGAAIYAVDEGLVKVTEPVTTVRIFEVNTGSLISADVEIKEGKAAVRGDFQMDGVPEKGSMITLRFINTSGAITGELLPTGNVRDSVKLSDGRRIDVSLIDAGNLYAFVLAEDLFLNGDETPDEIERNAGAMALSKKIFDACSSAVNEKMPSAKKEIKVQKMAIIKGLGEGREADFISRIISANGKVHKAYAVTGAISAGSAAHLEGSVVRGELSGKPKKKINISHPQGVIDIEIEMNFKNGGLMPDGATIKRTARRIMEGYVYVKSAGV